MFTIPISYAVSNAIDDSLFFLLLLDIAIFPLSVLCFFFATVLPCVIDQSKPWYLSKQRGWPITIFRGYFSAEDFHMLVLIVGFILPTVTLAQPVAELPGFLKVFVEATLPCACDGIESNPKVSAATLLAYAALVALFPLGCVLAFTATRSVFWLKERRALEETRRDYAIYTKSVRAGRDAVNDLRNYRTKKWRLNFLTTLAMFVSYHFAHYVVERLPLSDNWQLTVTVCLMVATGALPIMALQKGVNTVEGPLTRH